MVLVVLREEDRCDDLGDLINLLVKIDFFEVGIGNEKNVKMFVV